MSLISLLSPRTTKGTTGTQQHPHKRREGVKKMRVKWKEQKGKRRGKKEND
jgi:hypothetical protein